MRNIEIQFESNTQDLPSVDDFIEWASTALETDEADITIRIVDEEESSELNKRYRHKLGPTNVLSFPFINKLDSVLQGDVVICAPIVSKEAKDQDKPLKSHWAHLTVHGILHLQGYDHIEEQEANIMEDQEVAILAKLGLVNPYD